MKDTHDASPSNQATPEEILGDVIRLRRLELGLNEEDIVWEEQASDLSIHEIEAGTCQVCLRDLLHMAKLLETTSADLLERVEKRLAGRSG